MMKQNNPLRRLLAALLAALTLVSFTILPVLGAAEDEAADTEAAETTEAALDVELPAGTYECTAMFHNLDPDSGAIIGTAGAIITITIQH